MMYVHDTVQLTCPFHFPYSTVMQHADIPCASNSDFLSKTFKATAFQKLIPFVTISFLNYTLPLYDYNLRTWFYKVCLHMC